MRILLIDDDDTNARFLNALLVNARGPEPYHVRRVDRLFEALRRLGDDPEGFDAILLDLGLPECGGLTTLRLVRAHVPGVPIVVVTATDDPGVEREAHRVGADGYLAKGRIDGPTLEAALRVATRARPPRPAPRRPELRGTFLLTGQG